jgi:hypothetical protein
MASVSQIARATAREAVKEIVTAPAVETVLQQETVRKAPEPVNRAPATPPAEVIKVAVEFVAAENKVS